MFLLVGLGNPGTKYARNRHNAGFLAIDAIAEAHGFSPARSKFQGAVQDGTIGSHRALLLKPQTYYNESGNAVAAAARFHKIDPSHIIVFHDEIDLAPGKIRVKLGGGLAGNNGLRSTAAHMGPDFWRVRLGIGHPGRKDAVSPWVLGDFSKAEQADWLDDTLDRIGAGIPRLLPPAEDNAGRFMSAVAPPPPPPRPSSQQKPASKPASKPATPIASPPKPEAKSAPSSPFEALKSLKPRGD